MFNLSKTLLWQTDLVPLKALHCEVQFGVLVYFDHFDAGLEGFFKVGDVGDAEDAGKVGGDRLSANV